MGRLGLAPGEEAASAAKILVESKPVDRAPQAIITAVASLPYPPRLPDLHLDDGWELAPRRMPDHQQQALDDDRLQDVQPLVRLTLGEDHNAQHVTSTGGLDASVAGNVVGP